MSARPETGNSFAQLDPRNEASDDDVAPTTFISEFIGPFSQPIHELDPWHLAAEQRFIDERVNLLNEANSALGSGEYYLAKSSLRLVLENVLHSTDLYVAKYDPEFIEMNDGTKRTKHDVAIWLLTEAPYRVDTIAYPSTTEVTEVIEAVTDDFDDLDQTIVMQKVA